jgi:hypothetical protein
MASNHTIKQYHLLTDWYLSVLDGIADQDGSRVISDVTNSLEWLGGHLITGRYRSISRLGVKIQPNIGLDKFVNQAIPPPNAIAFDNKIKYPSLSECRKEWTSFSKILLDGLHSVSDSVLKTEISFQVPTGGNTVEDALIFVTLHESYHIGQMSIIRKSIGYNPMQLAPRK